MSKVYEALQHAYEDRHEVIQAIPIERPRLQPVVLSKFPPLKMEREMVQLQQRLVSLLPEPQHNILQFISCRKQEGVSTIVQEFARVFVEKQGKSILLLDGDSKKMTQHRSFGITPKISLQQIMSHGGNLDQAITPVLHSRLFLAQLFGDRQEGLQDSSADSKGALWVHLRKQFDVIVIDSSPIDTSDQSLELFGEVDGVVMVIEAEKTRSQVISHLKDQIIHCGGNLLGMVFNKQRFYIPNWIYRGL